MKSLITVSVLVVSFYSLAGVNLNLGDSLKIKIKGNAWASYDASSIFKKSIYILKNYEDASTSGTVEMRDFYLPKSQSLSKTLDLECEGLKNEMKRAFPDKKVKVSKAKKSKIEYCKSSIIGKKKTIEQILVYDSNETECKNCYKRFAITLSKPNESKNNLGKILRNGIQKR